MTWNHIYFIIGAFALWFIYYFYRVWRKSKPEDHPKLLAVYACLVIFSLVLLFGVKYLNIPERLLGTVNEKAVPAEQSFEEYIESKK